MSSTKLKDIAEAAGVSINTVSRVLSGKTKGLRASSAEKMERIQKLARSMEYMPNKAAQVMRTRRTMQIGMITHGLNNLHTTQTLLIVDEELAKRGYGLLLRLFRKEKNMEAELEFFARNLMDGVLNNHPGLDVETLQRYIPDIPVVTMDRTPEHSPAMINMESGVLLGLQHMHNLGHERIAIITGEGAVGQGSRRIRAYRSFYASLAIDPPDEWIMQKGWEAWDAVAFIDQFLETGCTACFAGNDALGMGFCTGLRMRGYEVPKDFSVVSMDDTLLSKMNYPQLTSVRLPSQELMALTVEALLARVEGKKPPAFQLLMPELIVRESVAPVK